MAGKVVIISAPSGAGKTTIVKYLLECRLNLAFSVSATTRPLRGSEIHGKDYFFMSVTEFRDKIKNDEFVEWEEVYKDVLYGTLKSELDRIWAEGNYALFDVDVKGGINLKKIFNDSALSLFIMPPSVKELKNRLINRGTDSYEKISIRVEKAIKEIALSDQFDKIIINDILEKAQNEAKSLIESFLKK